MKILAVNPGSTSTKIAVYEDETPRLVLNIRHSVEELSQFPRIIDQFEFRKHLVLEALEANDIPFKFDAIVGRGGLLKPIPGGVYAVNDAMLDDMLHAMRTHACNLGCLIAHELAAMLPGCPSFIADPGVVDELDDVARITGSPLMPSITIWHALNQRAIARRYAAERSALQPEAPVHYEDLNLIVCHLGGGVSVGVHRHGRAVDVPNALDGFGPFSPERAGTLPAGVGGDAQGDAVLASVDAEMWQPAHTNALIYLMYILFFVAIIATVVGVLFQFGAALKDNPGAALKSLIGLVILVAVVVISWTMGSEEPLVIPGYSGTENVPFWLKLTDMFLYSIYILFAGTVLAIIFSSIKKKLS